MSILGKKKLKKLRKITNFDKINPTGAFISYETLDIYDFESILLKLRECIENKENFTIMDFSMKLSSHRYILFTSKECSCIECGLKASFWALQKLKNEKKPHLNLYGFNENGDTIQFTKDHILPKSKGGLDEIENYQVMCSICNCKKGNETGE